MQHFEKYFSGDFQNVFVQCSCREGAVYFEVRATCITADTPVCTNVRKNSRYIKFVSLAWKIHVCILITVYADYTGMNYDDRTFTHKDQGLNKVTDCINKSSPHFQGVSEGMLP